MPGVVYRGGMMGGPVPSLLVPDRLGHPDVFYGPGVALFRLGQGHAINRNAM